MTNRAAISVIVPVHDGATTLEACLLAIERAQPPPAEIIVVCDGRAGAAAVTARARGCRVVEIEEPSGPATARNRGARQASHSILLFVDSDVTLAPDAVGRMARRFEETTDVVAVFGSYDDAPADPGFLSQYRNLLHHFVHQQSPSAVSTFWAGCGAVRREPFLAASGFDETYRRPSVEDIELGYRLTRSGHRIVLDRLIQGTHLKRWTLWSLVRTDVLQRALPWSTLLLSRAAPSSDLNLNRTGRWSVLIVVGAFPLALAGLWNVLFLVPLFLLAVLLTLLNLPFYEFLRQRRGLLFAVLAVPAHALFYLCGGVGFLLALVRHLCLTPPAGGARSG